MAIKRTVLVQYLISHQFSHYDVALFYLIRQLGKALVADVASSTIICFMLKSNDALTIIYCVVSLFN